MANYQKPGLTNSESVKVNNESTLGVLKERREYAKFYKDFEKELENLRNKAEKDRSDEEKARIKELEKYKDEHSKLRDENSKKIWENIKASTIQLANDIQQQLDGIMDDYLSVQEAMAYNLSGTGAKLDEITEDLTNAIAGTGIVEQKKVYENLSKLIQEGIVYNAEQRAYLQTLSDDLNMVFNASDGTLTRLINLQRSDLSDERIAIEYSLKEFLNQNFQTSQYIKDGFQDVSNALFEAQATMSASGAMALEASVQKWLGSLSSVGVSTSTVNSLATALGQIGSGNYSGLGNDAIQNLVIMGAARAGLNIGGILNNGLTGASADTLLRGISQYAATLSNSESNVVKYALGNVFGLNISDIEAIANLGNVPEGGMNTDVNRLLSNMTDYLYPTTRIRNTIANMMYGWATDIADNPLNYTLYKGTELISNAISKNLQGLEVGGEVGFLGTGATFNTNLAAIASATSILTTLPALIRTVGDGLGNLGAVLRGESATSIYNKLGNGGLSNRGTYFNTAGNLVGFGETSGAGISGSIIFNTDQNAASQTALSSARTTAEETTKINPDEKSYTVTNVYELLEQVKTVIEELPSNNIFATETRIAEAGNTVKISNDLTYIQDMITLSAVNIQNIYSILFAWSQSGAANATNVANVYDASTMSWNNNLDWVLSGETLQAGLGSAVSTGF